MILVADSGATKTDWVAIDAKGERHTFVTEGINPFHQRDDDIESIIKNSDLPEIANEVEQIFFYGAGCNYEDKVKKVAKCIRSVFFRSKTEVQHDMLAAARALCGRGEGIACILGTGSNSCFYDGENIKSSRPSLGYILGDEGSGAYIGKKLMKDYLYGKFPGSIEQAFNKEFENLSIDVILDKIYSGYLPNRYLASFTRFIYDNISNPYMHGLVYESFYDFLDNHVTKYPNYKELKVHFAGSVAYYFKEILQRVSRDTGVSIGNVIESPIEGLVTYHTNSRLFEKINKGELDV